MEHRTFSSIVAALPSVVPFTAPETLERRSGRKLLLRMGANESPYGPSPKSLAAMAEAAAGGNFYNDPEGFELRTEIATQQGTTIDHILLGAGIDDLLILACRLYLNPGDPVVTTQGGYPTFNYAVSGVGGQLYATPYVEDRNDLDGLSWLAGKVGAKLVYLANPDNPSGSWHGSGPIQGFRRGLPSGSVLILDEAYGDFAPDMPQFDADDPGLIRMRTFSKSHGMAGLRVGYAIAHPEVVREANKIRAHFGVNKVALAGALASLKAPVHSQMVVCETAAARRRLSEIAVSVGLEPLPSVTNFVAFDAVSRERADAILEGLLRRDVFIRKPGVAPLDRCIRVTVAKDPELNLFASILSDVVAGI